MHDMDQLNCDLLLIVSMMLSASGLRKAFTMPTAQVSEHVHRAHSTLRTGSAPLVFTMKLPVGGRSFA